jgi:ankyrin repeat protein
LHAAECGCLSVVKQLVSKNKSLIRSCRHSDSRNRAFNLDGSAIHYACRSGHLNIVKYLLEQDPTIINDLDRERWTPLHYACNNGHLNIVKLLLEYNPNVNIKDSYLSQTPIEFAMYKQFEDIVYYLDPNVEWTRRNSKEIFKKGNVSAYRKKSDLFLGRYIINEDHIKQIELFRNNSEFDDIELKHIQDVELNNLNVRIILTHDFQKHINKTMELISDENDDPFLRSSTTSTNEHIMVFKEE